jgi:hypothetical protein
MVTHHSNENVSLITAATPEVPTTENFCSGTMLVLIEQQLYNEISRLVGNVFYQLVLGNVTPLHFYSRSVPLALCALTIFLWT